MINPYNKKELLVEDRMRVGIHRTLLLGHRIVRCIRRGKLSACKYIPISILGLLCVVILVYIGILVGEYETIFMGMWDLKEFIAASIFVPLMAAIITNEKEWRNTLREQYNLVQNFRWNQHKFSMDFEGHVTHIEKINSVRVYKEFVKSTHNSVEKISIVGNKDYAIDRITDLHDKLIEVETIVSNSGDDDLDVSMYLEQVNTLAESAILNLRHPWIWDKRRDAKINAITSKY